MNDPDKYGEQLACMYVFCKKTRNDSWFCWVSEDEEKLVSERHVVLAKVPHSQRMNDPLVDIWIVATQNGRILLRL